MPYQLVLAQDTETKTRHVGDNVFLDNLPHSYPVYMLYYPGALPDEIVEEKLRTLGTLTAPNLLVSIGKLDDPNYRTIARRFEISNLPAVVITAIDTLSSPPTEFLSAYVRIDDRRLFQAPDVLISCLQQIVHLFLQGKVAEAIGSAKKRTRLTLLSHAKDLVTANLKDIVALIQRLEVAVSAVEGKLELKWKPPRG